jgi:hypothetical protein
MIFEVPDKVTLLAIETAPPILTAPPIPTPPVTCNAPDVVLVEPVELDIFKIPAHKEFAPK